MSALESDRLSAARRVAAHAVGSAGLQRLADLAATLLGAPSAGIAVLGEVQTMVAGSGPQPWPVGAELPTAGTLSSLVVASRAPFAVADARTDARTAQLPAVRSGAALAYLGVPLLDPAGGHVIGVLAVFGPEPRSWTDGDVLLLSRLAAPTVSELELTAVSAELEAGRLRWELAIDSAEIGSFDWDLVARELVWDDRMLDLFGFTRAEFPGTLEGFLQRVHPDDTERVAAALQAAVDDCGVYDSEFRAVLPSGEVRWIRGRGRAVPDDRGVAVRLLGAGYDSTVRRDVDARVSRVLESMPAAFFALGRDWRFTPVNAEAERLLGLSRAELVGAVVWELFPSAPGSDFEVHYRGAMESGRPTAFEAYYPPPLDSWYEVRAWPSPEGLSVYFLDVTERIVREERARRDARRLRLIAGVSDTLSRALVDRRGGQGALQELLETVVPELGTGRSPAWSARTAGCTTWPAGTPTPTSARSRRSTPGCGWPRWTRQRRSSTRWRPGRSPSSPTSPPRSAGGCPRVRPGTPTGSSTRGRRSRWRCGRGGGCSGR